jgi:hypothetical protein
MTFRYVKGIAAISTAATLLVGAGSVARAEVAPHASGNTAMIPAPPGSATADAVRVRPLDTCVSCTSAEAGPGSATSHATALRLVGHDVSAGRSLDGTGRDHGALVAVPANPLLSLGLLDWQQRTSAGETSTAHSRAALLDLALAPEGPDSGGALTVSVLRATSDAGYQGLSSQGSGSNDGAVVDAGKGALVIVLLHSDASSANRGSAYVLGINGTRILSSEQTGSTGIPITVPGVAGLVLLQVTTGGGNGATATGAAVGTVSDLLGQSGEQAGVLTASSAGVASAASPNAGTAPATGTAAVSAGKLSTPKTGVEIGLGGLLLVLGGAGLAAASLRRRRGGIESR